MLHFIGIGSAFNTALGNTSAYVSGTEGKTLLFDCGEMVFSRIKETGFFDPIKDLHVFITHNHPDHMGSLGSLIFYCYYLKKIPVTVYGDVDTEEALRCMGVRKEMWTFQNLFASPEAFPIIEVGGMVVTPALVKHGITPLNPRGFLIKETQSGKCIFYGGDAQEVPEFVLEKFNEGKIHELYLDVSWLDYPENVHLSYKKLGEVKFRNRSDVYIMHLDQSFNAMKAKHDGFKIAGEQE